MQETKFRAWDIIRDRFVHDYIIDGYSDIYDTIGEHELDHLELMQYTGLHDTNGIEIYVGDIIYRDTFGYYSTGVVIFEAGSYMVKWGDISELLYGIHLDAVVKGNIYENPEGL